MNEEQLIELTRGNSSFSTQVPGLQFAIDSTSLGEAKICLRRYFYSVVMGLQTQMGNANLEFGLFLHQSVEHYLHARTRGEPHEQALDGALEWVLEATWNPTLQRPWISPHKLKNRESLVRALVWYLDQWENDEDPIETLVLSNGKPAVELTFAFDSGIRHENGEAVIFCGHLDRMGTLGGEDCIPDIKTTGAALSEHWWAQWNPNNQMSMYALAGRVAFGREVKKIIIDAMQIGVTFTRCVRREIPRSRALLDEWLENAKHWVRQIELAARTRFWPMNDKACDLYGGCPFRELCQRHPAQREAWIRGAYRRRVWDPLQARGDV